MELSPCPLDGLTRIRFQNRETAPLLAASSWDGRAFIYDGKTGEHKVSLTARSISTRDEEANEGVAALDLCWLGEHDMVCLAGLDGYIRLLSIEMHGSANFMEGHSNGTKDKTATGTTTSEGQSILGRHSDAVRNIEYLSEYHAVISSGWDPTVKIFDPRVCAGAGGNGPSVWSLELSGKGYAMSEPVPSGHTVYIACSDGTIHALDIRMDKDQYIVAVDYPGFLPKVANAEGNGKSSAQKTNRERQNQHIHQNLLLSHQIRCVQSFPDQHGYVVGTVEGRVAVFHDTGLTSDSSTPHPVSYAFRCHRKEELIYPVNSIKFHPTIPSSFVTAGADGTVNIWDAKARKKLMQLGSYPTSVASIDIDPTGQRLAVAVSYTFEDGEKDHAPNSILLCSIADDQFRPKKA